MRRRFASARAARSPGRLLDASATGLGLLVTVPIETGEEVRVRVRLEDSEGRPRDVRVLAEVRSCRPHADGYMLGARIVALEPEARVALMEWCYVVCSHQEVRGSRPGDQAGERVREPEEAPAPLALPLAPPRLVPQPAARIEPLPAEVAA